MTPWNLLGTIIHRLSRSPESLSLRSDLTAAKTKSFSHNQWILAWAGIHCDESVGFRSRFRISRTLPRAKSRQYPSALWRNALVVQVSGPRLRSALRNPEL